MSHGSIREYAAALRPRYQAASKEGKGRLLDEFCAVARYHRKAAVRLLSRAAPGAGRRRGPRSMPWIASGRPGGWPLPQSRCGLRFLKCTMCTSS